MYSSDKEKYFYFDDKGQMYMAYNHGSKDDIARYEIGNYYLISEFDYVEVLLHMKAKAEIERVLNKYKSDGNWYIKYDKENDEFLPYSVSKNEIHKGISFKDEKTAIKAIKNCDKEKMKLYYNIFR